MIEVSQSPRYGDDNGRWPVRGLLRAFVSAVLTLVISSGGVAWRIGNFAASGRRGRPLSAGGMSLIRRPMCRFVDTTMYLGLAIGVGGRGHPELACFRRCVSTEPPAAAAQRTAALKIVADSIRRAHDGAIIGDRPCGVHALFWGRRQDRRFTRR